MDWANDKQRDLASRIATAFASTEVCDVDLDPRRVEAVFKANFGDHISARQTADLLYMIGVLRATQGVQLKSATESEIKDRCQTYQRLYGPAGTEIKGILR